MGGVKGCGRGRGVWWMEWRCVGGVESGGRGGGEFGKGCVWGGQVSRTGLVPFPNF